MNKQKKLQKGLIKKVVIMLLVVAVCGGVYALLDTMASSYMQQKSESEAELAKDTGEREQLKAKIEGAKQSEQHYIALMLAHTNPVFEAKKEDLVPFLNASKASRRLPSLKVTLSPESTIKDTIVASPDYEVTMRDEMQLEFDAISDLHAYAFVTDLIKNAPGFFRVKSFTLDRKSDLNAEAIGQLTSGATVTNVTAKLSVMWVGIRLKDKEIPPTKADAPKAEEQP